MLKLQREVRKRFGLVIFGRDRDEKRAVEIIENRNSLVHNWGIVNRTYMQRVPWSKREIGDTLSLSTQQMSDDIHFLLKTAGRIDRKACSIHGGAAERTIPEFRSRIQMLRDDIALIKSKRRKKKRLSLLRLLGIPTSRSQTPV